MSWKKGGVPEYEAAARTVLQDWNAGKIAFYTEPPREKKGIHLSAQVVSQFSQEIKLDEIFLNEETSGSCHYMDLACWSCLIASFCLFFFGAVLSGLADTNNDRFMSMGTSVFSSTVDTNFMRHLGTADAIDMEEADNDDEEEPKPVQLLQTMYLSMACLPALFLSFIQRYVLQGDEDESTYLDVQAEEMVEEEEEPQQDTTTIIQQRKLEEDEDKLNPQLQRNRKKQLKMLRKMRRKGKEIGGIGEEVEVEGEEEEYDLGAEQANGETLDATVNRLGLFTPTDLMSFLEESVKKSKKRKGKEKAVEGDEAAGMDEEEAPFH